MDKPIFDFSGVNREWQTAFSDAILAATEAQQLLLMSSPVNMTYSEHKEYLADRKAATALLKELATTQRNLIIQVIKDVPRDWLSNDAPARLNWDDAASLNYVRPDKYGLILQYVQQGGAETEAKN